MMLVQLDFCIRIELLLIISFCKALVCFPNIIVTMLLEIVLYIELGKRRFFVIQKNANVVVL